MITPMAFLVYARYNAWMNENIYSGCEKISDADRKQDRGAFFKSIHGTLNHILVGDRMWMARFTANPSPAVTLDTILHEDFDQLRAARRAFDRKITDFVSALKEEWLTEPFSWTSKASGRSFEHPRWFLLMHMFNHQTHHRGQVTTLMKQCGVDPGPTDLPMLPNAFQSPASREA